MSGLWLVSYIALWLLVILLTIIVLGSVRQLGLIHVRLGPEENLMATQEGLELESPAPDFLATDVLHGREMTLADLRGRPSVLVFISPGCRPCQELIPHLTPFQNARDGKLALVLFSQAKAQESIDLAKANQLKIPVLSDPEGELSKTFRVRATPFAYRLDQEGLVRRRGIVNNLEGQEELLQDASPSDVMIELPESEDKHSQSHK